MERTIMVKSEVQENGDVFLYYVDENGDPIENEDGMVTTIDQEQLQQLQENFVLEEIPSEHEVIENYQDVEEVIENNVEIEIERTVEASSNDEWLDQDIQRLLIFYIDNKKTFMSGSFSKNHLWSVACQMTLDGKNPDECETQLNELKNKYKNLRLEYFRKKIDPRSWPYYELCHKAFHDDVESFTVEAKQSPIKTKIVEKDNKIQIVDDQQITVHISNQNVVTFKKRKKVPDDIVNQMLELYLQHKKMYTPGYGSVRNVWEKISMQLGDTADNLYKRFLNYKRHYIALLEKRHAGGQIDWPYMAMFDEIFKDDPVFKKKYVPSKPSVPSQTIAKTVVTSNPVPLDWNDAEKTILVKYYFDCIDEFQDPTIPKAFLWNEVGRLLDKKPEECKKKYEQLRKDHLSQYIQKDYDLRTRKPIAILFDNIISKEVEATFCDPANQMLVTDLKWKTEKTDDLVNFFLDNIELFKDPICHFVCWAAVAVKVNDTIKACKDVWNDLTSLYKSILIDKKEDSDLQIDWRYIDSFDKIFDYGLDTKLLEGCGKKPPVVTITRQRRSAVAKAIKTEKDTDNLSDIEEVNIDENDIATPPDPNAVKILEYYMKYKDKYSPVEKRKHSFWGPVAEEVRMSTAKCAAKFKSLKQLYTAHIQREITKPEKPILWPYYPICKKAFGYRAIRSKLKSSNYHVDGKDEWATKDIKKLIHFAGQNFKEIEVNPKDETKWKTLSKEVGKSESACRDMFLQLSDSYLKLNIARTKNPQCNVNWKYYKLMEALYNNSSEVSEGQKNVDETMDSDCQKNVEESMDVENAEGPKQGERDDEYQCIIVVPEGKDLTDLKDAKIIIKDNQSEKQEKSDDCKRIAWNVNQKKILLTAIHEYVKENVGKDINTKVMWKTIGDKLKRKPFSCRKMYTSMKCKYQKLKIDDVKRKSEINKKISRILKMRPKFVRPVLLPNEAELKEKSTYTDVDLPLWAVEKALKYYLDHVEEFVDPKYDRKNAWIGLTQASGLVLSKAFRKINYLKQFYNSETNEVAGKPVEFGNLLKEILEKEFICKIAIGDVPDPLTSNENTDDVTWTDDETKVLLHWYLENLEMFKNPKYNQNYLWLNVPSVLNKSPLACSKQMANIRKQYSSMAKGDPISLASWEFFELCQKIYGTGKKDTN